MLLTNKRLLQVGAVVAIVTSFVTARHEWATTREADQDCYVMATTWSDDVDIGQLVRTQAKDGMISIDECWDLENAILNIGPRRNFLAAKANFRKAVK